MQTTLRIDDQLYRKAKMEAAREGISLTKYLEDSLRRRLDQGSASVAGEWNLRVCEGKAPYPSGEDLKKSIEAVLLEDDLQKLGSA
ncbi:MAG: CopG family transcriptional regulator [Verrucomicrobia bacterium]|nr:CopG family transcriptional regulator [Verrucomicrobiota bacterium]MDA1066015.1 CopG family transcriptional regulator [Verrucomicrobiota bacterium]